MCCMCFESNEHTSEDAFFRHMTKPKMTGFGEVYVFFHNLKFSYYEGKEYEVRLTDKKPGQLSQRLRVLISPTQVMRRMHWA